MKEKTKRIVLTRYWPGDVIYHISDKAKGLILHIRFDTTDLMTLYFCVFDDRKGEWCHEMEISDELCFSNDIREPTKTN